MMAQLPSGAVGAAAGVLAWSFTCLSFNAVLLWLLWTSNERRSCKLLAKAPPPRDQWKRETEADHTGAGSYISNCDGDIFGEHHEYRGADPRHHVSFFPRQRRRVAPIPPVSSDLTNLRLDHIKILERCHDSQTGMDQSRYRQPHVGRVVRVYRSGPRHMVNS